MFKKLCGAVEQPVDEEALMSEHFTNTFPLMYLHKKRKMTHGAHEQHTSVFICGEIKLDITLRLLTGAYYFDLCMLCSCGCSSAHLILIMLLTIGYVVTKCLKLTVITI